MKNALVVVSGTGTEIGKTHFSEVLLRTLGATELRVVGYKPIETGLMSASVSDGSRLDRASTFHVEQAAYLFGEPVSPHLASRLQGEAIELDVIAERVASLRETTDVTLVELAGGLFTPVTDELVNADVAQLLQPDRMLLVAPDRLGVLHDLLATLRAAAGIPLQIDGIVLIEPPDPDSSTGSNADEIQRLQAIPVVLQLPRGTVDDLCLDPRLAEFAQWITS